MFCTSSIQLRCGNFLAFTEQNVYKINVIETAWLCFETFLTQKFGSYTGIAIAIYCK